jgi:hypothetical protein
LASSPISEAAARGGAKTPWAEPRRPALIAFCLYLALALAVTWPWVIDPGDVLYGVQGSDLAASVSAFQQDADELQPPFLPGRIPDVNAPEGQETTWALAVAGIGHSVVLFAFSVLFGSIAAHGLLTVLGLSLTALAMFLLVRRITGSFGVAVVIGLAFGFWPYTYVTGWTWPPYIQLWVFPLLFWRMLEMSERPTLRNGLLAGGAAVLALTWLQYNLLIGGVLFATLAAAALVRAWRNGTLGAQVRAQAVAAAITLAAVIAVLAAATASDFTGLPTRTTDDAVTGSARPLMYLLPGPNHPLFGNVTGDWLLRKYVGPLYDPNSTAQYAQIYVGIPLLLLALAGLATLGAALRRRGAGGSPPAWLWPAGLAAIVGLVGLLFSAPPSVQVLGVSVPMPYTLINEVTPVFRAAHRFAVLAMMGLCILAAIGLAALLPRGRRPLEYGALGVVGLILAVDLWGVPDKRITHVDHPPVYRLLENQPKGIVAEYPFRDTGWTLSVESFFQDQHEHPIFKGFDQGSASESRKLELQYLLEPRTVPDLARYGVRYVIVHEAAPPLDYIPKPGARVPGLTYIGGDRDSALYRVTAQPAKFTTYAPSGFNAPEGEPPGVVRWLRDNGGTLEVLGDCEDCRGTLTFTTGAFARDRTLTIRDDGGGMVFSGVVGGEPRRIRIPLRFSRRATLSFATDPPPDRVNEFVPGEDTRSFGVFVSRIEFRPR